MSQEFIFFTLFLMFVLGVLGLDLGVFSKTSRNVSFKNAIGWTAVWVSFGLLFYFLLSQYGGSLIHGIDSNERLLEVTGKYQPDMRFNTDDFEANLRLYNHRISIDFLTGYFIEYSLSVDNLFVILLVFTSFAVPSIYYKKILFWGVIGAIVMRMLFIFIGAALIVRFEWVLYLFGGFLVFSGIRMLVPKKEEETIDAEKHFIVKFTSRYFSVWPSYVKGSFVTVQNGKKYLTPLFIVLLVVEFSDLIFAVDSVPAIFAVTKDPYIVFFSNIFAIMGLRSLFFLLSNVMYIFRYLKYGLGILLTFVGCKMLFEHWFASIGFNNVHSLLVIFFILAVSILLSLLIREKDND